MLLRNNKVVKYINYNNKRGKNDETDQISIPKVTRLKEIRALQYDDETDKKKQSNQCTLTDLKNVINGTRKPLSWFNLTTLPMSDYVARLPSKYSRYDGNVYLFPHSFTKPNGDVVKTYVKLVRLSDKTKKNELYRDLRNRFYMDCSSCMKGGVSEMLDVYIVENGAWAVLIFKSYAGDLGDLLLKEDDREKLKNYSKKKLLGKIKDLLTKFHEKCEISHGDFSLTNILYEPLENPDLDTNLRLYLHDFEKSIRKNDRSYLQYINAENAENAEDKKNEESYIERFESWVYEDNDKLNLISEEMDELESFLEMSGKERRKYIKKQNELEEDEDPILEDSLLEKLEKFK
jgi:hypothetical protein